MVRNIQLQAYFILLLSINALAQPAGYYNSVSGLDGEALKTGLHKIIRNHNVRSYSEFRDVILRDLDEDPNNPDNIILFYKNNSIPKSNFASNNEPDFWNREHTWPSSHGFSDNTDTAYTDVHNLRPSDATVNTSKSNKDFDDIENTTENAQGEAPETYTNSDFWEPRDNIKGDVARILLYMDVRYNSARLDLSVRDRITFSNTPEIGVLFTLLRWHNDDPVDDYERARHNKGFTYQNNRNPFIDHPEYVEAIWGDILKPLITQNLTNFSTDFGTVSFGEDKIQKYTIRGYNLESDIAVEADGAFSLSSDGTSFSQEITLTNDPTNSAQDFDIFVKFAPTSANGLVYDGAISHSTTNGASIEINVQGKEGELGVSSIAEARTKSLGSEVQVTGVVIDKGNNSSNSRIIFDGTAGIIVRSFDANNESSNLNYGDSILVTGGLSEFGNVLQIEESPITIELLKENAQQPTPQVVTIADIGESLESELVTISNVFFEDAGGVFAGGGAAGNFTISDGTGSVIFRIGSSGHPLVGTTIGDGLYNITGFVGQFFDDYQLSVRDLDDLELAGQVELPVMTIAEARNQPMSTEVLIAGIIIGGQNNDQHNRILFDGTAGIVIRSLDVGNETSTLQVGDSISIRGGISNYFGTLQLVESPITLTLNNQGNTLPEPQLLESLSDVNEDYESELITVEGVSAVDGNGNFQGGGNNGLLELEKGANNGFLFIGSTSHPLTSVPIPENTFSLTGYVSEFNGDYRISPRTIDDIIVNPLSFNTIEYFNFYPNPVDDVIIFQNIEVAEAINIYNLNGQRVFHLEEAAGKVQITQLNTGFYIVSFHSNGKNFVGKIFKK